MVLLDPDGVVLFETLVQDGLLLGQIIVDQGGTTYLAGHRTDRVATACAIDVTGAMKWTLDLPGEHGKLLGVTYGGRL